MGLDMWLRKAKKMKDKTLKEIIELANEIYIDEEKQKEYENYLFECGEYYKYKSLFGEVSYWRKANAIHRWFVCNVQAGIDNCEMYEVKKEDIEKLLDICKEVDKDNKKAEELLPTQSGFFFGSTEYDEWYYDSIKNTIKECEKILNEFDFDNYYLVYDSSW